MQQHRQIMDMQSEKSQMKTGNDFLFFVYRDSKTLMLKLNFAPLAFSAETQEFVTTNVDPKGNSISSVVNRGSNVTSFAQSFFAKQEIA